MPKGLPDAKTLNRVARNVYTHWKQRREQRKGKSIFPSLNYDEANDGDPYVCFRRRDIRATRKTRRTDNYSVEKFQKLQHELQAAAQLASMVLQRERHKQTSVRVERELWEAKWKLFETKRKWPSLGLTREEDELITGRAQQQQQVQQQARVAETMAMANGANALQSQSQNVPQARKKQPADREKDDRDRRERAMEAARAAEKGVAAGGRSMAPESFKERMQALRQKLEDAMAKHAQADAEWDDMTDMSYQPLPPFASDKSYRSFEFLVPNGLPTRDASSPNRPASFRLRRGRGGLMRLDRRVPVHAHPRGKRPDSASDYADWLFPDNFAGRPTSKRPKSIDDVDRDDGTSEDDEHDRRSKRRRLTELQRYNVDSGGAVGVGMGLSRDDDRIIIDDMDPKYIRNRVTLLQDDDLSKLVPDMSVLEQTNAVLDAPVELPPLPQFIRPEMPAINPMMQQQLIQQQNMERMQAMAAYAQQAAYQQQLHQQQAQMQGMPHMQPQPGPGQHPRPPSDASANGHGSPAVGNPNMLPPQVNGMPNTNGGPGPSHGRPPVAKRPSSQASNHGPPNGQGQQRPSVSPTYPMQGVPQVNGNGGPSQSPQMVNGVILANGKPLDPAMQRMVAARMAQNQQQQLQAQQQQLQGAGGPEDASGSGPGPQGVPNMQPHPAPPNHTSVLANMTPEQQQQVMALAQKAGYGDNLVGFLEAKNRAKLLSVAKQQQQQQAQTLAAQQAQRQQQGQGQSNGNGNGPPAPGPGPSSANGNGSNTPDPSHASPRLPSGQLNLKLPAHAAARLGAKSGQQSPAQRA